MPRDEPLVTIAIFSTSFEALLAKGALAARGIDAYVPDEEGGTSALNRATFPVGGGGSHGTSVPQVFESDRDRAVAELNRIEMTPMGPSEAP
jgi:hypothetical protein